ncbi:hypothetical protein BG006_006362 [Podila minutissima]|uniref:Glutathione S-transferase n=1 Tax=Podila minutissima TaxID=64525 RepID=A0A9P5SJ31_9FUNG|nr:hypothetical protein BG006_006362 [Podila minutissima]
MSYPVATKASSAALAQAASLNSADSKFQLFYFGLQARAEIPRLMLAYAGANVEHVSADWPTMKEKTRFGCLPVMFETTSNGTVLEFAESQAIERYIAKKFNLLGENVWEEQQINEFVSSIDFQLTNYTKVMFAPAESRHKEAEAFHQNFAKWILFMERHLIENGNNGHFVGNRISWADLKAAVLVGRLSLLLPSGMEVPKLPEALVKVVETVKADSKIAAWMATEEYQKYDANTKGFFKF